MLYSVLAASFSIQFTFLVFLLFQNDIEVPIPKYFLHERQKVLKDREQLLGKILSKMEPTSKDQVFNIYSVLSCVWGSRTI